jgi:energy-converting hydrogenase Eha subunit H
MGGYNIGDILFQLFSFTFLVLILVLIVSLFRSFSKRKNQLNSIEKKIDSINEQIKKENDY